VDVAAAWNLVGSITFSAAANNVIPIPPVVIQSGFYGFDSNTGFYRESALRPGRGYWVRVNQPGRIVMRSWGLLREPGGSLEGTSFFKILAPFNQEGVSSLTVTDVLGRGRTLYFSDSWQGIDADSFELPPRPPEGVFDVRFRSQRLFESADFSNAGEQEFSVDIQGASFPLTFSWDKKTSTESASLEFRFLNKQPMSYALEGKGSVIIDEQLPSSVTLRLTKSTVAPFPREYAVSRNYPNPFNPSTQIGFDLPEAGYVLLEVYGLLGEKVVGLVSGFYEAGYHTTVWNGKKGSGDFAASGVYFARLAVSDASGRLRFSGVSKLLLMK
jgi:hypothetical protein